MQLILRPMQRWHIQAPYIKEMLDRDFDTLQYSACGDEGIATWFSHALAHTCTPESIAVIREFASSANEGIATEIRHRLQRIAQYD